MRWNPRQSNLARVAPTIEDKLPNTMIAVLAIAYRRGATFAVAVSFLAALLAASPQTVANTEQYEVDDLMIVDCLLPGRLMGVGQARVPGKKRPARLEAYLCRIKGGIYTAYDRASLTTSVAIWEGEAARGNVEAALLLGRLHERGGGAEPDYRKARLWYEKAAQENSVEGKLALASLYERGLGVAADPERAFALYRDAMGLSDNDLLYRRTEDDREDPADAMRAELDSARSEIQRLESDRRRLEDEVSAARASLDAALSQPPEREPTPATVVPDPPVKPAPDDSGLQRERELLEQKTRDLEEAKRQADALKRKNEELERALATQLAQQPQRPRRITSVPRLEDVPATGQAARAPRVTWGRFVALVVTTGNDDGELAAISAGISRQLQDRYRFDVITLRNPSAAAVLQELARLRQQIKDNDNVLVFYAGPSRTASDVNRGTLGYWVTNNPSAKGEELLPHDQVTEYLNQLPARRVLLMTTGIFNNGMQPLPMPRYREPMASAGRQQGLQRRARILIAGDRVGRTFLQLLETNSETIDAPGLWDRISTKADPAPPPLFGQLAPGGEGGQFFLVPRDGPT